MKQKLKSEMIQYMKEKKKIEISCIRMVNASIQNREKALKRNLTDEEILDVINKQVKEHKDSLKYAIEADRADAQKELNIYISILEKYLPEPMDESQAKSVIEDLLKENNITSASQKKQAMGAVMPVLKGKIDGKIISDIVSELLV